MEDDDALNNKAFNINKLRENTDPNIMKNICKIEFDKKNKKICGSGFLCKIELHKNEKMPVLITSFHLLNDNFFKTHTSLSFIHTVNGSELTENLKLDNRIIYTNDEIDITIIEIKEEDNLDIFSFLGIDNSFNIWEHINENIYLLHYPGNYKDAYISQGNINNHISESNYTSNYSSKPGSSGGAAFYKNNLVFGVHNSRCHEIRKGTLIKEAIKLFIDYMTQKKIVYKSPYSYLDTIDIVYYIPCKDSIRLFGEDFVCRYRNICKIIYKNSERPLTEYFHLAYDDIQSKDFRIKLKGVNFVTDMSSMFRFCENLLELPNISRMDTSRVTDMNRMLEKCVRLEKLEGINRWNVQNVLSMQGMFYNCYNLKSLPEINEWKPIKLNNCKEMFCGCKSLTNSEVSKIENWTNVNEILKKDAVIGYKYGRRTNIIVHSVLETINNWIK